MWYYSGVTRLDSKTGIQSKVIILAKRYYCIETKPTLYLQYHLKFTAPLLHFNF